MKDVEFTPESLAQAAEWATTISLKSVQSTALAEGLKESGKDLLSLIMVRLGGDDEKLSQAKLETLARASDEWREFREGQLIAMKEAIILRQRATNAERFWSTIQSGMSYRKQEMAKVDGIP